MEQDNRIPPPKQILRGVLDALINAKLSSRQAAALIQCSDSPATMGEIAKACGFSTAAATGMVDTLEKRGLVRRHTGTDRRSVKVSATPDGQAAISGLTPKRINQILFVSYPPDPPTPPNSLSNPPTNSLSTTPPHYV